MPLPNSTQFGGGAIPSLQNKAIGKPTDMHISALGGEAMQSLPGTVHSWRSLLSESHPESTG